MQPRQRLLSTQIRSLDRRSQKVRGDADALLEEGATHAVVADRRVTGLGRLEGEGMVMYRGWKGNQRRELVERP